MNAQRAWKDYLIPGTDVLRNKVGLTTHADLTAFEEAATRARLLELKRDPIQGQFDYAHMKAIHRYIFQDVYEWAGQERTAPTTPMSKWGPDVVAHPVPQWDTPWVEYSYFPAGERLTRAAEAEYSAIREQNYLKGLPRAEFTTRLATSWALINVIHSFREGNTRSQFVFFSQLSEQAGYRLDVARFGYGAPLREEFVNARYYAQKTGQVDRLVRALGQAIEPIRMQHKEAAPIDEIRRRAADVLKQRESKASREPVREHQAYGHER
ncbi:MAG: Fic family protein [Propionibacteriaceae bacterium]|nr:Fic family protein [Propionibacteriaceae bacterium]